MADNFTSLRNDRIRIFHLVAPCLLRSRKHRVKGVHPSIEATRLAHWNPMNRGSVATLARGAHSKHSAGVIPFVLDSRFLNKVSRPLPRGPPPSIPDFTRSIILVVKRDEREKIGKFSTRRGAVFFENLLQMDTLFKAKKMAKLHLHAKFCLRNTRTSVSYRPVVVELLPLSNF